jgi:hypothetical protein
VAPARSAEQTLVWRGGRVPLAASDALSEGLRWASTLSDSVLLVLDAPIAPQMLASTIAALLADAALFARLAHLAVLADESSAPALAAALQDSQQRSSCLLQ